MPFQRPRTAIGRRTQRVTFYEYPTVSDGMGGQVKEKTLGWIAIGEAWAQITALDERTHESLEGRALTAQQSYHVDVRYRAGIYPQMRLTWGDKTLEIQSVADDLGSQRRLIILASEVQGATASAA